MEVIHYITRHAKKVSKEDPESKIYEGLSETGVEQCLERAKDISDLIEKSPCHTVALFAGHSDSKRTESTLKAYFDAMPAFENITVIYTPLRVPQFCLSGKWNDEKGKSIPYIEKVGASYNGNQQLMVTDWIKTGGKFEDLIGPHPDKVAEDYLNGLTFLESFAKHNIMSEKPLIIFSVAHCADLDALVAYAVKGKVDDESFATVSGDRQIIQETEPIQIIKHSEKIVSVKYRGREFKGYTS